MSDATLYDSSHVKSKTNTSLESWWIVLSHLSQWAGIASGYCRLSSPTSNFSAHFATTYDVCLRCDIHSDQSNSVPRCPISLLFSFRTTILDPLIFGRLLFVRQGPTSRTTTRSAQPCILNIWLVTFLLYRLDKLRIHCKLHCVCELRCQVRTDILLILLW